MDTVRLGALGALGDRSVSRIGLGAMPLSLEGRPSEADAIRVIHASLEAGVTLIDTADVYCIDHRDIGHNERLIAQALKTWPRRDEILVATKGGLERPRGAWVTNGRPAHLKAACDASLRALGVDAIDLYQLHAPDDDVPFAESVGALSELRAAGKIRRVGLSNVSVAEIAEARAIVEVVSVQNRLGPLDRSAFADGVVACCEREGLVLLAYSPVGGGHGKERIARHPVLGAVGARHRASPFRVALAWLLQKSRAIVPIPGASRIESALDSAAAATLALDPADVTELDRAFPV
jgi:aryl-alcohol dehydrogenase-like predicted oxidoreductase